MLIFVLYAQGYADEHFPLLAHVTKESVNVRAGANTNFEVLAKFGRGAEVVVLGKNFDWYKIQLPTTAKAYIRADYLKLHEDSFAELTGDKVNIRARANSDSSSLGQLNKGDRVKTIQQVNGWWQIEPPAQAVGWIHEGLLNFKGPVGAMTNRPYSKLSIPAPIEIRGKLTPLNQPQADIRYQLIVDGKPVYYIQNIPHLDYFQKAVVRVKGHLVPDPQHQYNYPVLRITTISLFL